MQLAILFAIAMIGMQSAHSVDLLEHNVYIHTDSTRHNMCVVREWDPEYRRHVWVEAWQMPGEASIEKVGSAWFKARRPSGKIVRSKFYRRTESIFDPQSNEILRRLIQ